MLIHSPSLFGDLFGAVYHAAVCLSPLITEIQDLEIFVIPMWFFSSLPARLSTHLTFDICKNEASRVLIKLLKAAHLWKFFSLLMVCRLDREYVINEGDYNQPLLTGLRFNTAQFSCAIPALAPFLFPLSL